MKRSYRRGDWLATDDYTGFTTYGSKLKRDYLGNYAERPLERNQQELAKPLTDPTPVPLVRPQQYEVVSTAAVSSLPTFIGITTVSSKRTSLAAQVLFRGS